MNRRAFLLTGAASLFGAASYALMGDTHSKASETGSFPFELTDKQWRDRLTKLQYSILREHGTERAHSSPLNNEKRDGIFSCNGCNQALYSSKAKYNSGTGWPSFYESIENAVGTSTDKSFFMTRTEVHCSRCGGHLGHIFDDGPQPTGKRHCINGVAMNFQHKAA